MNDDLKLGYHRLGRRFEDPPDLFALALGVWTLLAMLFVLALSFSFGTWLLLTAAGAVVLFLLRDRLTEVGGRWRESRRELESRHPDPARH